MGRIGWTGAQAHLRDRERVRRHVHVPWAAAPVARRGRALPVPARGLLGPLVQRLPAERCTPLPRRRQPPRVRHARMRLADRRSSRTTRRGSGSSKGLVVDAEKRLHDEGIAGDIYLFKNNTDSAGNSYGCHENYLVGRHGEFSRLADVLIPFLVTRQLICGAGKVLQTPRGAVYCISQRAEHIWEGVSSATTRSRPIINTRDEPHADAERYRRLHVIVGDSNMNECDHDAQGRFSRPGAAHDRARRDVPRPDAGEPDPGHPRDQPRPHRHPPGAAGRGAHRVRAGHPARVLQPSRRLRRTVRQRRLGEAGPRTVGPHPRCGRDRRPVDRSTARSTGPPSTS